jgi:hypothetical protein
MKASDKVLLNIFSRYAAGELPRAALKSFVRQAQLERKGKKADAALASHNWAIRRRDSGDIVRTFQADDYNQAFDVLQQYKRDHNITDDSLVYGRYNPSEEQPAQTNQGNWGIWIDANSRFANQPGEYARGAEVPLMRFPTRAAAEQWIEQQRAERPNMRSDIEVREIEPAEPIPGSTLDLQRQRAAVVDVNNLRPTGPGPWEVANRENNQVYYNPGHTNRAAAETEARTWLGLNGLDPNDFEVRTRQGASSTDAEQGGLVDVAGDDWNADFERSMQQSAQAAQAPQTLTRPGQGQQVFTGEWKVVDPTGNEIYRFGGVGNSQRDANRVAIDWLSRNPQQMTPGVEVLPVMGPA